MNKTIQAIPIDRKGNLLFIKDFEQKDGKMFLSYKSGYNDIPFRRVEVYIQGADLVITADDGTVIYRFAVDFLNKISTNE
jgi:hypothetical protein